MITEQKQHRVLHVELRALLTKQKDAVYKLHTLLIRRTRPKRNMSNAVTLMVSVFCKMGPFSLLKLENRKCLNWNAPL